MFKLKTLLESLHFPLWIIKDFAWFLGLGWISLIFAIPTIIISIVLIGYTSGLKRIENAVIWCWLSGNTFWMLHELFSLSTYYVAIGFFILGLFLSFKILPNVIRKFIND